jgi:ribosomal-protein-alanine N-acetyltransferase
MVSRYRIRDTRPADVAALRRLEIASFSDPWTEAMLEEALVARGAVAVVAEEGDSLLGSVMARQVADEGEILSIAVTPAERRQGVARLLLEAAVGRMAAAGARTVWLEVRASNQAAQALYLANGFVAAGVRRGYYRRPTEDALVFTRHLSVPDGNDG